MEPKIVRFREPKPAGDAFMFVVEGRLTVTVDGRAYDLGTGDLAIVPKGAARGFAAGPEGATFMAAHLRG